MTPAVATKQSLVLAELTKVLLAAELGFTGTLFKEITVATLSNLPNDLLLYIFSVCSAQTIGVLRQCCKEFNRLTHTQIVWLKVLETACADLNLPMPSFQRNEHSSSDVELLATAWIRFQWALRTASHRKPPLPKRVRSISTTATVINLEQSADGRFLFVADTAGIRVWDLLSPSPTLMSSLEIELSGSTWGKLSVETLSNNGYLVYLCASGLSRRHRLCFRFTFASPEHGENQLHLLSELDYLSFPARWWNCWFTKPLSPVLTTSFEHSSGGKHYLLWDPVAGTCATWAADNIDTIADPIIVTVKDFVIAFENESQAIVVYARPEIPPKSSYTPGVSAMLSNPALFHIPGKNVHRPVASKIFWKTHPNRGHPASNHGGTASIHRSDISELVLERVKIIQTASSSPTFAPLPLQCEISHSQYPHSLPIAKTSSGYADVCADESLLLHVASRKKIVFHLSSSKEHGEGAELCRGILYDSRGLFDLKMTSYTLCSFAGRLCVTTADRIEVVDFVELPNL
ncbi:hypothetical protein DL96DRAFT_1609408 [Flagelloscypha sp. PMI_526]|nr:hypothetical protein DL96DRAFT_1609408 [Flagelloscypha sp. PMI_526]